MIRRLALTLAACTALCSPAFAFTAGNIVTYSDTTGAHVQDSGILAGTMAGQNANGVAITGGTIAGQTVGSVTVTPVGQGVPSLVNDYITNISSLGTDAEWGSLFAFQNTVTPSCAPGCANVTVAMTMDARSGSGPAEVFNPLLLVGAGLASTFTNTEIDVDNENQAYTGAPSDSPSLTGLFLGGNSNANYTGGTAFLVGWNGNFSGNGGWYRGYSIVGGVHEDGYSDYSTAITSYRDYGSHTSGILLGGLYTGPALVLGGHLKATSLSAAPSIATGTCGGTGAAVAGAPTDFSGEGMTGSSSTSTCIVAFGVNFGQTPRCMANLNSGLASAGVSTISVSAMTITFSSAQTSALFTWNCTE
jgi:hypothetical protein